MQRLWDVCRSDAGDFRLLWGGGETETVAQAGTHRGGRCGRGRSVVEEGEVEAVVRVVSKRVEDVGVEPVLKHRAAEWVR